MQIVTGEEIAVWKLVPNLVCLYKQAEAGTLVLQNAWNRNLKSSLRLWRVITILYSVENGYGQFKKDTKTVLEAPNLLFNNKKL